MFQHVGKISVFSESLAWLWYISISVVDYKGGAELTWTREVFLASLQLDHERHGQKGVDYCL